MDQEDAYWEFIADKLQDTSSDKVHPKDWKKARVETFLVKLEDKVIELCKSDEKIRQVCRAPFRKDPTGKEVYNYTAISFGTYLNFWRIFKSKNREGGKSFADYYAVYFGYASYSDTCEREGLSAQADGAMSGLASAKFNLANWAGQDEDVRHVVKGIRDNGEFIPTAYSLLKILFPRIEPIDNIEEIDFLYFTDDNSEIDFAFKIVVAEKDNPKTGIRKCTRHLNNLHKVQTQVFAYFIIYEGVFEQAELNELEQIGNGLTEKGVASMCLVYDILGFATYLTETIDSEIRNKIVEANKSFKEEYARVMDQQFYYPAVPFYIEQEKARRVNPRAYIAKHITEEIPPHAEFRYFVSRAKGTGKNRSQGNWLIVLSEFGFGKTSLLLNTVDALQRQNVEPIFIPLAQMPKEAFMDNKTFLRVLLKVLYSRQRFLKTEFILEEDDLYDEIAVTTFLYMLRKRDDIVFFLDGLDENYLAYSLHGLRNIFERFASLGIPCIITARKEFWDDRQGTFNLHGISSAAHVIQLVDWGDIEIGNYLRLYFEHVGSITNKEAERLNDFIASIDGGKYESIYGDIPKRPLFLQMLVRDILSGNFGRNSLSLVYESYLHEKLRIDITRAFADNKYLLPINMFERHDLYKVADRIFSALTTLSAAMLVNDEEGKAILLPSVLESQLEKEVELVKMKEMSVTEILLNSVLIPIDKRGADSPNFRLKFAHKSFQEFFTARYLFGLLDSTAGGTMREFDWYRYNFESSVSSFIADMLRASEQITPDLYRTQVNTLDSLSKMFVGPNTLAKVIREKVKLE